MAQDHGLTREAAERRVREKQARRMAELVKAQEKERRKDFRLQKEALDQNARKEAALTEAHRLASERLEREWQQQRDRLAHTPAPAPVLALMPAAQRDLRGEYERAHQHHRMRREALDERFTRQVGDCRQERAEQLEAFGNANRARESTFEHERVEEAERQKRDFETLVHRQMLYGRETAREEFARSSRQPERQM